MGYRHARLKALLLLSARGVELSERSYGNVEYPVGRESVKRGKARDSAKRFS